MKDVAGEPPEPDVVRAFLLRAWVDYLDTSPLRNTMSEFTSLATCLEDLAPLLEKWADATSPNSTENLAEFVIAWDWAPRSSTFIGTTSEDELQLRSHTEARLTSDALKRLRTAQAVGEQESVTKAIEILECLGVEGA